MKNGGDGDGRDGSPSRPHSNSIEIGCFGKTAQPRPYTANFADGTCEIAGRRKIPDVIWGIRKMKAMNPDWLLSHFNDISEVPDAVPRLRRFILDLAVRGKLVEQDPKDEPASTLVKQISLRARRQANPDSPRNGYTPMPPYNGVTFRLPASWEWLRLDVAAEKISDGEHLSPQKTKFGMPLLTAKHVLERGVSMLDPQYVSQEDGLRFRERCDPRTGDVLICSRGTIGRCCVVDTQVVFCLMGSVILFRPHPELNSHYLNYFLKSEDGQLFVRGITKGMAVNALYLKDIKLCPVPLPPLPEQHRIVAKVDELMALCDELEAAQQKRERRRDRLVAALLNGLNNGDGGSEARNRSEFEESARFYFNHLPRLTIRPEDIQQLRQAILNLAVRGQLVPQDPNDEPASELLKRIQAEKVRLVKEGRIRRQEYVSQIEDEEMPFQNPSGWLWARLANISRRIHYGYTASANQSIKGVRLLRITDIQNNSVDWASVPGCEVSAREIEQYKLEQGDILIARTGGTIGKTFLVRQIPVTAVFASYLIRVQGSSEIYDQYLKLFLESPVYWKQLQVGARGGAQPNVNGQTLGKMLVSVPPLAEQHRIVARVHELMALCDEMDSRLSTTVTTRRQLLEATLNEAVSL
jgi:type I restriction enzyme S subunit